MTVDINKQLKAMIQSHDQLELNLVINFLQTQFQILFEKYKKLNSISISSNEEYNDNDYSYNLNLDSNAIIINGHSLFSMEDNDIDQDNCEEECDLSFEDFNDIADTSSKIFNTIDNELYMRVFGEDLSITIKSDEIQY
jgi:hypothetical protein